MRMPIIGNAFTLHFSSQAEPITRAVSLDGESLMEKLVSRGFVAFRLQWEGAFEAQLAIEDDVIYIFDAIDELAAFATGAHIHHVHLGDGELEIASTLSADIVATIIDHTPHLDQRFHRRYEFTSTLRQYLSAWNALANDLESMAKSGD